MATRSARKRKRRMVDKPIGQVVLLVHPKTEKSYYDISIGRLRASAEWRETR